MNHLLIEPLEARIAPATLALVAPNAVGEGNSGTTNTQFKVTLSEASAVEVTVHFMTVEGTATESDFNPTSGTLTFAPGDLEKNITVAVLGDAVFEQDEEFTVVLDTPTNASIEVGKESGTAKILNDDSAPTISIADISLLEGTGGTTVFEIQVTRNGSSQAATEVSYATANGTATEGVANDYTLTTGTLTFGPEESSKIIQVPVNADAIGEFAETFFVNLSSPVNGTLLDGQAQITILNDDPVLKVADAGGVEGGAGGRTFIDFPVTLEDGTQFPVTVNFTTESGTATEGIDYEDVTGQLTFTGNGTQFVHVPIIGDNVSEGRETFTLKLSGAVNADVPDDSATGSIYGAESNIVSVRDLVITEGDSGETNAVFVISLEKPASPGFTLRYTTVDGTATSTGNNADFTAQSGTVTFASGDTSHVVTVPVHGDLISEATETFELVISDVSDTASTFIADSHGVATINDTDPAITVSIDAPRVAEGNAGDTKTALFTVHLSSAPVQPVTVRASTIDGTAVSSGANPDYDGFTDRLITFNPGDPLTQEIAVTLRGDSIDESDETFSLQLSSPQNGHLGDSTTAVATIANDEIGVAIDDISVAEGNSGTKTVTFNVTLSAPSAHPVSVNFQTVDGTATSSGTNADYVSKVATVTFAPNETTHAVTVVINGDQIDEGDETFVGRLSSVNGAVITKGDGTATINDDDQAVLSVADVSIAEGPTGTGANQIATFTIRLSGPASQTVSVRADTVNGSASAGADYTSVENQIVTFNPGETSKTVAVTVIGDNVDESDETFDLVLSDAHFVVNDQPAGAVGFENGDNTGTAKIVNDDVTVSVSDASVAEGNAGEAQMAFTLTLSAASAHPVTVQFATSDVTAGSGSVADYVAKTGSVTFEPGETSKQVMVSVLGDTRNEPNETFNLVLSAPENATIADATGVGTIVNDEIVFTIEPVGPVAFTEDNGANASVAKFKIKRTAGDLPLPVSVTFSTVDGTATSGSVRPDYVGRTETLTFTNSDPLEREFEVSILKDARFENDETFKVVLSNAVNGSVDSAHENVQFTILNDDAAPTMTIEDATVAEGDQGTRTISFNVRLTEVNEVSAVTVNFETQDGTATSVGNHSDFVSRSLNESSPPSVTFPIGETSRTINIVVNSDLIDELNDAETFSVLLSGAKMTANDQAVAFTNGDNTAIGTITDDDVATILFGGLTNDALSVTEGTGGETTAMINVALSRLSERAISVDLLTLAGTASLQTDLVTGTTEPTSLTFAPVTESTDGEQTKSVALRIVADAIDETNETLKVRLQNAQGALVDPAHTEATITIADDDPSPVLTINNVSIDEGNSGTRELVFTVALSGSTEQPVTVDFATVDGTAKSKGLAPDFIAVSGALDFRPGEATTKEIRVPIIGDTLLEGTIADRAERFTVNLSNASNATIGSGTGTARIIDDGDTIVGVSINDRSIAEGDQGQVAMAFNIELSGQTTAPISFTASTHSGTAASGADFVKLTNQTVNIPAQQTSGSLTVQVIGDTNFEGGATESFFVTLGNPSANAALIDDTGRGTIYNDDLLQVDAQTVHYIDVDGDLATVHVSSGTLTISNGSNNGVLVFGTVNSIGGRALQVIDLAGRIEFAGASVSVTAKKQTGFPGGLDGTPSDGVADVGFIRAAVVQNSTLDFTDGIDLGRVKIDGDLGKIVIGDRISPSAIQSIDVGTFGGGVVAIPSQFADDLGARTSASLTAINRLLVHGDFLGNLRVIGEGFGDIGTLHIDGALRGDSDSANNATGQIFFTGTIAHATIGSIVGGSEDGSAIISGDFAAGANIGTIKVLGAIKGGAGGDSGEILAPRIKNVTAASIEGGAGNRSGVIRSGSSIGSLKVLGDIIGGSGASTGDDLLLSGGVIAATKIKNIRIDGTLEGGSGGNSASIIAGGPVQKIRIGEDIRGGAGSGSGTLQVSGNVKSLRLGNMSPTGTPLDGDLLGGTGAESGRIQVNGKIGTAQIFGDVKGGSGSITGGLDAGGKIEKIEIFGNLEGGNGTANASLTNSGFVAARALGSFVLNGDLIAGEVNGASFIASSGAVRVVDSVNHLTIRGDVVGKDGNAATISALGGPKGKAFKNIEVFGNVRFAEILAGYDPVVEQRDNGGNAVRDARGRGRNADAQIGSVVIHGEISATNIVAGVSAGADKLFGTADDVALSGTDVQNLSNVFSQIASVIVNGAVVANSTDHGIVAQHVVAVRTGVTNVPLTEGPVNDVAQANDPDPGVLIGPKFRALEVVASA